MEITKEDLNELYNNKVMSIAEIADKFHCDPETIRRRMIKWDISRRSSSETAALKKRIVRVKDVKVDDLRNFKKVLDMYDDKRLRPVKESKDSQINISIPLELLTKNDDIALTLVLSDLHLGDANFLPQTFMSCVKNLQEIVKVCSERYKIKGFNIIVNGDIVSGREVYRYQSLRNLLQRGHWQVFLAEVILRKLIKTLPVKKDMVKIYLCKGTHEALAENYLLYLKKALLSNGFETYYLSHSKVLDVAKPVGNYYVYFTHGFGKAGDFPVSSSLVKDLYKAIAQYKRDGVYVPRACCSHSHWLATNLYFEGLTIDVSGGFQKWEYTNSQRPVGMVLYLYSSNGLSVMEVKPDNNVERAEKNSPALEYKNLVFYGQMLLKHFEEIEGVHLVK